MRETSLIGNHTGRQTVLDYYVRHGYETNLPYCPILETDEGKLLALVPCVELLMCCCWPTRTEPDAALLRKNDWMYCILPALHLHIVIAPFTVEKTI